MVSDVWRGVLRRPRDKVVLVPGAAGFGKPAVEKFLTSLTLSLFIFSLAMMLTYLVIA